MLLEMVKFGAVGSTGIIVDLGILYIMHEHFHAWYLLASVFSSCTAMTTNFILNKIFVFESKKGKHMREYGKSFIVQGAGIIIANALYYGFVEYAGMQYIMAKLPPIAIVFFWNYFWHKFWVFKKTC